MDRELVCARCHGRVSDGGCPTCRVSRREFGPGGGGGELPAGPLLLLALLVMLLIVVLA